MDIQALMYFKRPELHAADASFTQPYCVAVTESGQVYYCEADEQEQPNGNWRLVNIDLAVMQNLH